MTTCESNNVSLVSPFTELLVLAEPSLSSSRVWAFPFTSSGNQAISFEGQSPESKHFEGFILWLLLPALIRWAHWTKMIQNSESCCHVDCHCMKAMLWFLVGKSQLQEISLLHIRWWTSSTNLRSVRLEGESFSVRPIEETRRVNSERYFLSVPAMLSICHLYNWLL